MSDGVTVDPSSYLIERLSDWVLNPSQGTFFSYEESDDNIVNKSIRESEENKKTIDIIVEDNGEGIKEDDLKRIYEMFYTTKKDGSGIGIPLCNEIIKLHNGKLNYYSKENIGTKVVINLPKSLQ